MLLSASRRRERRAVQAVAVLCYEALLAIRGTAYTGEVQSLADVGTVNVDVMEWIRMLADACHTLPKSLQPSVAGGREHRATDAIHRLLATASPPQRQWLVATLANNDITLEELTGRARSCDG